MIKVRFNLFETNSSSVHTITIVGNIGKEYNINDLLERLENSDLLSSVEGYTRGKKNDFKIFNIDFAKCEGELSTSKFEDKFKLLSSYFFGRYIDCHLEKYLEKKYNLDNDFMFMLRMSKDLFPNIMKSYYLDISSGFYKRYPFGKIIYSIYKKLYKKYGYSEINIRCLDDDFIPFGDMGMKERDEFDEIEELTETEIINLLLDDNFIKIAKDFNG